MLCAVQVEAFEAAVAEWNDGKVNDFNSYTNTDWTYDVTIPCGTDDTGSLAKDTSTELERDDSALGAEIEEQATFANYKTLVYSDDTSELGTVSQGATGDDCEMTVAVSFKGTQVQPLPFPLPCACQTLTAIHAHTGTAIQCLAEQLLPISVSDSDCNHSIGPHTSHLYYIMPERRWQTLRPRPSRSR